MVVRRSNTRSTARKPASTTRKPAPAKRAAPAKKAAPVKKGPDVTAYADKEPTGYHKAFARWIVKEVGYDPNSAESKRAAFLAGVSIATAARPAFQSSDFLAEYRATTGEAKRGPKPGGTTARKSNRAVVSDDEFEDESDEFEDDEVDEDEDDFEDDDESEEDDDEFDDDEDDSEEDDDSDDDDDFDDDEEDEPEPPKRSTRANANNRGSGAAKTATRGRPTTAKKATPARRGKFAPAKDNEDLF